ncbi:hypothetical protein [Cucumibacter marinus]|uniref:hypothetical protein n=1 Tax=Cucumibacter marinus TaxID=1121252 RepID=UPI0004024095|nr:hypothetical protein [Cucumibacter marinus]
MLSQSRFLAIVRMSAIYDLVVTAGFMTPWTLMLLYGVLQGLDAGLGLPGEFAPLNTVSILFANLLGSVVVVWALARLHLNSALLGRYDAAARWLFAAWQFNALLNGASWLIIGFLVVEIAFGIAQLLPVREEQGRTAAA